MMPVVGLVAPHPGHRARPRPPLLARLRALAARTARYLARHAARLADRAARLSRSWPAAPRVPAPLYPFPGQAPAPVLRASAVLSAPSLPLAGQAAPWAPAPRPEYPAPASADKTLADLEPIVRGRLYVNRRYANYGALL